MTRSARHQWMLPALKEISDGLVWVLPDPCPTPHTQGQRLEGATLTRTLKVLRSTWSELDATTTVMPLRSRLGAVAA